MTPIPAWSSIQDLLQIPALDVFHYQEPGFVFFYQLVERHDIGVSQPGEGLCLAAEALTQRLCVAKCGVAHRLYGERVSRPHIVCEIDKTHAACIDLCHDAISIGKHLTKNDRQDSSTRVSRC